MAGDSTGDMREHEPDAGRLGAERSEDRHAEDPLRAAFADLRSDLEAGGSTPPFEVVFARARAHAEATAAAEPAYAPPPPPGRARPFAGAARRGAWASLAMAAGLAGLWLAGVGRPSPEQEFEHTVRSFQTQVGGWRSPTDGLLAVPGMEMMRSLPTTGGLGAGLGTSLGSAWGTLDPAALDGALTEEDGR